MTEPTRAQIEQSLATVTDTNLGKDLAGANVVKDIRINPDSVQILLQLGYPANGYRDELTAGAWIPLATNRAINDQITITDPGANRPQRFYRVVLLP